ncbi:FAR-17a/AIG1-like protein [Echria macrotheca]|uniref:FAR-17a/AIG1-like protein n=1 Tax=Echria macrotheca TaxID=438768 RepID=A0AAJ0FDE4_9PEZI|nr:FAR-17a/AIG1-like protein [Echria macrotheca]
MAAHPLQRLSSPSRSLSALVHVLGLLSFAASFDYMKRFPNPLHQGFGGNYQFLTIIGLSLATATFAVGLLADLTLSPQLFRLKNVLSVCSAPLEVLISVLYWGISAIDKKLVVPPELALPLLPDFGFHAMPAIMLSLDLILLSPPWTIRAYGAWTISMVIAFLYWFWIEYCFAMNGWYPYPLFGILATWQRVALFTVSAFLMTGSTMALKWVYGTVNGNEQIKRDASNPIKVE